jgi:DNA-binding IclR family transcriptional regulator
MTSAIIYTDYGMAEYNGDNAPFREKSAAVVQSVDRALVVLEILGKLGMAGVTEIASALGVHKSTVSRLIAALESRGFVEQLSDRGKYRLGFAIVRLAGSTSAQMDLAKESQPICDALAAETGETTNVAILDGDRIINIVETGGSAEYTIVRSWIGQRCPAYATSSGKVLLAALPTEQVHQLYGEQLASFTTNTITDRATLDAQLARARHAGWSSASEELELGLNAVAAPVRRHTGEVIAALSVSGPSHRFQPAQFESVAGITMTAADRISRRLGFLD